MCSAVISTSFLSANMGLKLSLKVSLCLLDFLFCILYPGSLRSMVSKRLKHVSNIVYGLRPFCSSVVESLQRFLHWGTTHLNYSVEWTLSCWFKILLFAVNWVLLNYFWRYHSPYNCRNDNASSRVELKHFFAKCYVLQHLRSCDVIDKMINLNGWDSGTENWLLRNRQTFTNFGSMLSSYIYSPFWKCWYHVHQLGPAKIIGKEREYLSFCLPWLCMVIWLDQNVD